MALAYTNLANNQILPPVPLELQAYYPSTRWYYANIITGDASGGTITNNVDLKITTSYDPYFHIITNIEVVTDDLTAEYAYIEISSIHFLEGIVARRPWKAVFNGTADFFSSSSSDTGRIIKPIYLGKTTEAGEGKIPIIVDTNVNLSNYVFYISGYSYGRPPLATTVPIM